MSTTIYIDPQGKRHLGRPPRSITLPPLPGKSAGQTVSLPADCSPAAWRAQPGCTTIEEPDPEPIAPTIPDHVKPIALQLLALWATTKLPLPADWPTARAALIAWRDAGSRPARDDTARELRLLHLELTSAGATWPLALSLSSTASTVPTESTESTPQ